METQEYASAVFGNLDENIALLEKEFLVDIAGRGICTVLSGDESNVIEAGRVIDEMMNIVRLKGVLDEQTIRYCINMVKSGEESGLRGLSSDCVFITSKGKPIKPKTLGQKKYITAIEKNYIVFGIGPAGTGKTYLSVVMAVRALKNHEVARIILTRPAVEAGEKLGFLPGDLQTKIDPYLRPLYDALFDTMGQEGFQRQLEKGV
ncbi:MAG: PhoH family protein, partial [Oscillospiraceae bacterium]